MQEVQAMKDACKGTFDLLGSAQEAVGTEKSTRKSSRSWPFCKGLNEVFLYLFSQGGGSLMLKTYPCQVSHEKNPRTFH